MTPEEKKIQHDQWMRRAKMQRERLAVLMPDEKRAQIEALILDYERKAAEELK